MLSGINHGANLGADVYYSGTVAAVRETILHGWPGIAFSHYRKGADFDWARATRWITPLLRKLLDRPIEPGLFYNVNLPLLAAGAPEPEVIWCPLDPKRLPLNYRTKKRPAYISLAITTCAAAHPRPMSMSALTATSPSHR